MGHEGHRTWTFWGASTQSCCTDFWVLAFGYGEVIAEVGFCKNGIEKSSDVMA